MKIEKGFKFIDLFCGIGGFHQAMTSLGGQCVFASDIDRHCQQTYKENYFHYFDIRNTQLNEKGWRRSFSINQLLYGMILYTAKNGDFESFDDIMNHLSEQYGEKNNE